MPKLLIPLVALAALLTGCAGHTGTSPGPQSIPHSATVLQWGIVGTDDVPTLDPALASDQTSLSVASLVYGGLVRLDSRLLVRPDGADRWRISPDGRTYTFHIRPTLRFPDGRRATAADFREALVRAMGPAGAAGSAAFYLAAIAGTGKGGPPAISAPSSDRLVIRLRRPAAHFLAELAFPASFVPDLRLTARYGETWTDHAAGFGPYRVARWEHTRLLTLVRNPYYWAGRPVFRRIVIRMAGITKAVAGYRTGAFDLVSGVQVGQTLPQNPVGLTQVPALALDYLAFNTRRLPFFRLNVRRAFAAAWQPRLVADALPGAAFPAKSFLPASLGVTVPAWQPSARPAVYLAHGRYPHGHRFPPVALILPRDAGVAALAQDLVAVWRRSLGVTVTVHQLDSSVYNKVLAGRTFDLALVRWGADYPDPQDFLGTQLGTASDNTTGWATTRFDRDVQQADAAPPGDPRRTALFRQAASLAARKLPLLPLDEPSQTALIRPSLHGVYLTPLGTITGNWTQADFTSH